MADESQKNDKTESNAGGAPAGFDIRVGREKEDGWLRKTPGQTIMGRLLGFYTMKNQEKDDGEARTYFQFRVGKCTNDPSTGNCYKNPDKTGVKPYLPGVLANSKNENKENVEVILQEGQVLNIDCHTALEELKSYAKDGGIYDVYIQYQSQDKMPGRGNMTFWSIRGPFLRCVKPPTVRKKEENDIPF